MKHRNSQKRIYIKDGLYFITTNVGMPFDLLKEKWYGELFVAGLHVAMHVKEFDVFGYKVNPDHVHLLIQPTGEYNYSEIMRSLKTNFSRNANYVLGYNQTCGFAKGDFQRRGHVTPPLKNQNAPDPGIANQNAPTPDLKNQRTIEKHFAFINQLKEEYESLQQKPNLPKFKWQSSFHFHVIVDKVDYYTHLNYIKNQWKKHELKGNEHCFVSKATPDLSYTVQLYSLSQ